MFLQHTTFNTHMERVLQECAKIEFKEARGEISQSLKESIQIDKKKYYIFNKCHKHETNECIHRKDAIED